MRVLFFLRLCRFLVLGILPGVVPAGDLHAAQAGAASSPVELTEGWAYRTGDSPLDDGGVPVWTYGDSSGGVWRPFTFSIRTLSDVVHRENPDAHTIWLRVLLPAHLPEDPTLLVRRVSQVFEAYAGMERVYRSGDFRPRYANKYEAFRWHLVSLPETAGGSFFFLRVYSGHSGHTGVGETVVLGSRAGHLESLVRGATGEVVLGAILVLLGLFGMYIFFRRRVKSALSFGMLSFCVGLYSIVFTGMGQFFWDYPAFWWYAGFVPFFLFPVGMWSFSEQILEGACSRPLRLLWQAHLLFAAGALCLDLTNVVLMPSATPLLLCLLVGGILLTIVAFRRSRAAAPGAQAGMRLLGAGFAGLSLFGMNDILMGFGVLPGQVFVFPVGVFGFVLLLAYFLECRFADAHTRLQLYSRELEARSESLRQSNEKLAEYSHTLEDRVAERTRDLSVKNGQLEVTLRELREAQNQLVMREKMVSLGRLVAGVAHEVNTPVGAINSAADVSTRCIGRLESVLEASSAREELAGHGPFQQAMKLLKENARLILTAGKRVATIVQSLKNFARLDEAEFQTVDVHEGLESTLALVQHELKHRAEVVREYGKIPAVRCYPNQLNQVFMNLLINAAQAIERKGTITVRTFAGSGAVYIQVADTGKGIPPENLSRIFDPGFTTRGVGVGTGLGLSISYSIVEKHNGRIEVESTPGKGSVFTVCLPYREGVQDPAVPHPSGAGGHETLPQEAKEG